MHDQKFLNDYFTNTWSNNTSNFIYSGYAIVDKIHDSDLVIDIGCGANPFKGKIKNLIGVDPTDHGADVVSTIEEYQTDTLFDVALCLGSINFGSDDIITNQMEKVNNLLKPNAKVFWRLNPGRQDHDNNVCDQIDFYPWTFERLAEFAAMYGFTQGNQQEEVHGDSLRLYAEWIR